MTLSPVFRSEESIEFLRKQGYLDKFQPALDIQKKARDAISKLVYDHYDKTLYGGIERDDMAIFEKDFFLILFIELCRISDSKNVDFYAMFNYCIRGKITAADNIFDNESKKTLPFKDNIKGKLRTILELTTYEQLFHYLGKDIPNYDAVKMALDKKMVEIGKLESSEENGVSEVIEPEQMINSVHRVRGGALFELGMIAPMILEPEKKEHWKKVNEAIHDIGTAFQIVDDITDFEFDLKRKSHNLVLSEIYHKGTPAEKEILMRCLREGSNNKKLVETHFIESVHRVVQHAYCIARKGFVKLQQLGFWYDPDHTDQFVNAILGDAGNPRIKKILDN